MRTCTAGEKVSFNRLLYRQEDGKAYHLRNDRAHPIIGVCLEDAEAGSEVKFSDDHDAVLLALQLDAADRA